jgi:nucleoside-triphosphatase THEP1
VSVSNKKCFISYSNNLPSRIRAIIDANKDKVGDDLELVILDRIGELEYKLLFCEYYINKYSDMGYEVVSTKKCISYRVSVQYSKRFDKVFVCLYNTRRDKRIVAQFNKIADAKEFIAQYYVGRELVTPVYGIGENRYI